MTAGLLGLLLAPAAGAVQYDLILRGGTVYDGSGAPAVRADVGIIGQRIAAVGDLARATGRTSLDVDGMIVAPGFIDLHSHADAALRAPGAVIALNLLRQGVTTVVVGQDGRNGWPGGGGPGPTIAIWEEEGLTTNVVLLVGHGDVRRAVMGPRSGPPSAVELGRMRARVREALEAGAYGISTGLGYVPGRYASTEELVTVIAEIAPFRGVHVSHLRDQGDRLVESVREIIEIAERTRVTSVASHFKAVRPPNYGKSEAALREIREARARGIPIYTDQYPYRTSSNGIAVSFLPPSVRFEMLRDPALRSRIGAAPIDSLVRLLRSERPARGAGPDAGGEAAPPGLSLGAERLRTAVRHHIEWMGGAETFTIEAAAHPGLDGRTLAGAARVLDLEPEEAAIVLDLLGAHVTQFHMSEPDIERIMRAPFNATSSDGLIPEFGLGLVHPRSYGSFPRKLRRYVFERGVLTLEAALRSMSGLTAEILGFEDRGYLREGGYADLVVFDPHRIRDRATYADPHRHSEGVLYVLVNGTLVLDGSGFTGAFPGQVLRPADAPSATGARNPRDARSR